MKPKADSLKKMNEINNTLKKADFFFKQRIPNYQYWGRISFTTDAIDIKRIIKNIENIENFMPISLTTQPKRYFP